MGVAYEASIGGIENSRVKSVSVFGAIVLHVEMSINGINGVSIGTLSMKRNLICIKIM